MPNIWNCILSEPAPPPAPMNGAEKPPDPPVKPAEDPPLPPVKPAEDPSFPPEKPLPPPLNSGAENPDASSPKPPEDVDLCGKLW